MRSASDASRMILAILQQLNPCIERAPIFAIFIDADRREIVTR